MSFLLGRKWPVSAVVIVGLLCAALGYAAGSTNARLIVVPFQDAKFTPINSARPDGPSWSVLWGNPDNGPSAMLMKLQKGSSQMHVHTSDYHYVLLQGTMKHWDEVTPEDKSASLGPGSYLFQPGGQAHAATCFTDECIMFINWAGKRDGMLAPAKK